MSDLSALSSAELRKRERDIAARYQGEVPWGIVAWAFGNLACWLALWPLVLTGTLPLWAAFPIACVNIAAVYLPTHDAQHYIIGRPGTRLYRLNEAVGHATSWLLVYPFEMLRVTHMDHHRHTNDPERDVDITTHADSAWGAVWQSIRERQPGAKRNADYLASLLRAGRTDLVVLAVLYKAGFVAVLSALAWNGHALEALLLWWLPYQIAITYIVFFLSWAPHNPGMATGRYRDTRSWRSKVGNVLSMGMQYHVVHHLYPTIPLTKTPAAYRELLPILKARGVRIDG